MKYIVTSDIHLGHIKTPTSNIIKSFMSQILTNANKDADILFISGDLFDRLLDFNSKEVQIIIEFFNYLLSYCQSNDIKLRVLEGTPSHDWQQSSVLFKLNDIRANKADLIYHKVLDIEFMPSLNKHILYIPDEWSNNQKDIELQIQAKLAEYNILSVDIAILHGTFKYQTLNKPFKGLAYDEKYFLGLVKGYIHIGHHHRHTEFDRIIANGSLDRLAHGEEEPKGYIIVDNGIATFMENHNSYTYVTLNITKATTIERLDANISKFPPKSYVRLLMNEDHPFNINFIDIKLRYIDYSIKKLLKEHMSKNGNEYGSTTYILSEDPMELSTNFMLDSNIYELLVSRVTSNYTLSNINYDKFLRYITPFKNIGENDESATY